MKRRGFLGLLGAAIAGAAYDPERLLFVPGRKLISIPRVKRLVEVGDILTFGRCLDRYKVTEICLSSPNGLPATIVPVPLKVGEIFTMPGVYVENPLCRIRS